MVVLEEPDTVVPYVWICGGTGGAIRPPTRLLTMPARRSFSICARHKSLVVVFAVCCRSGRGHGRTSEAFGCLCSMSIYHKQSSDMPS